MSEPEKKTEQFEGWMQSSTCRALDAKGKGAGREYGLGESMARTLARLLKQQAKHKFGSADEAGRTTLDGLAQAFAVTQLQELGERLIAAASWSEWLSGVTVPPPAPPMPEYTKNLVIDLEPSGPSIDTRVKVPMFGGGEAVIHLRFQKWYQPNLDKVLYEESLKLERKYKVPPLVCVFLMWPPAEGPGMTGRYEVRDMNCKLKREFTYQIRRAWEIEPEEATQSPGTMILAPLTRNSKERMPEIVQMIRQGLDRSHADAQTRHAVWDSIYWSMGLICDLEEAHRALGDELKHIHQSHYYLSALGHAFLDAHSAAQTAGPLLAARTLVLAQGTRRFGERPGAKEELEAVETLDVLEGMVQRALTAASWEALLARG